MAHDPSKPKLEDLQDKDTADAAAAEVAAIDEAANAEQDAPERSPGEQAAEDAELKRQEDVRKAVAKANEKELPKLGGPLKNPGLGE
ncbi:MAG TPA: hypothetical protein VGQ02_10885 [Candidatus Limnocylindrales bacterium]|jgi:hypothetical protein|nr:hypothetical protein [Candidatus Limnocylindrales bacterium]